jgi:hypothetical protein
MGLNLLNPDAFIARHNIDRGDSGEGIDIKTLLRLSDDAALVIADYINSDEFVEHQGTEKSVKIRLDNLNAKAISINSKMKIELENGGSPEYKSLYDEFQEVNRIKRSLQGALRYEGRIDSWKELYQYNGEWQAWNLSRWQAKLVHEGLED